MQDLINSDQSGYIKKRFIGHNIRTIQDLISYAEKYNKEGVLLFLDFKKAFDSLEWDFLHKVIRKFNFGKNFQRWVKIFYTEPEAIIKNNGWLSENFRLSRGIRQGCPLSALLFIFAVEILAIKVRTDPSIKGFNVTTNKGTQCYRVSQYADDSVLILKNVTEILPAMEIVKQFGNLAGLELNLDKTKIMLIGNLRDKAKSVYNIECVNNIKSLGIYVGHDKDVCIQHNWFKKIDKMRTLLKSWQERSLTLFGKITIIKSLVLPIISFSALHTVTPQCALKSINTLIYRFLWGRRDKIKRTTTIGTIEQGGLGMVDVESYFHAIKASWIKRLHNANETLAWAYIPLWYMNKLHIWKVINLINAKDINQIEPIKTLPRFYRQVIEGYITCNIDHNSKEQCFRHTCLWGNEKLLNKQKKVIFFPHWIESGIIKIDDIRFIDNKVDEVYLWAKISNKSNYLSEIYQIKSALQPFINNKEGWSLTSCPCENSTKNNEYKTTKQLYEQSVNQKFTNPRSVLYLQNVSQESISHTNRLKIKYLKDKQIAEFNYKLLNDLLICRQKLQKWGLNEDSKCVFCSKEETVEHLMFTCHQKFQIWKSVHTILKLKCGLKCMFVSTGDITTDWALSVVQFCIYKVTINYGNGRFTHLQYFLRNIVTKLNYIIKIYSINKYKDVVQLLKKVSHKLASLTVI